MRTDPLKASDLEDLYVLRIEVYPEDEDSRYFSIRLRKKKKVLREEACSFDEKAKLKAVWGAEAYNIFLRNCHRTHIPRDLEKEAEEKAAEVEGDAYFDSDIEGYEE